MKKINDNKNLSCKKNVVSKNNIKKRHRRKKTSLLGYRIKLIFTYGLIFFTVCAICFVLSSTVLFKINKIEVQGDNVCDYNVLIEKSGIKKGENLFFTKVSTVKDKLEKEIPSIDKVNIKKKIPNTIILDVKKANRVFEIENDSNYIVTNENGKVLSVSDEYDENLILLQGMSLESYDIGSKVTYKDESVGKKMSEIVNQMKAKGLFNITGLNFNDGFNVVVDYDNRIKINLGLYENMDYKIRTVAEILNNKIGNAESGTLDLSVVSKENRSYFTPSY